MGHFYGPNSAEVKDEIQIVDDHINKLLDILEENNQEDVDVIIVSDHGMASLDELHKINITGVINMEDVVEITEGGSQAYIWPKAGKAETVNRCCMLLSC